MRNTTLLLAAFALAVPTAMPAVADAGPVKLDKVVTFEPGARRVRSQGRAEIRKLARGMLAACPTAKVTVEGNAYFEQDEEASIALGQARADRVRDQFIKYGFAPDAVVAIGHARRTLAEGNGRHVDIIVECK